MLQCPLHIWGTQNQLLHLNPTNSFVDAFYAFFFQFWGVEPRAFAFSYIHNLLPSIPLSCLNFESLSNTAQTELKFTVLLPLPRVLALQVYATHLTYVFLLALF